MATEYTLDDGRGSDFLTQLELILETDPQIDEVGFVHPSQFAALCNDSTSFVEASSSYYDERAFWHSTTQHKLGISTQVLIPLCKAAKVAFFAAIESCDKERDCAGAENDVMKHSRALLLLSSDFGTAWNSRKRILSNTTQLYQLENELHLSALVLSQSPKSEQAWSHRRWVIKVIAKQFSDVHDILGKESQLVKGIAESSKMNYRAWNHRCWLVSYMTSEQMLHELKICKGWSGLHPADNSCFHYRRRLLLGLLKFSPLYEHSNASHCSHSGMQKIWMEELDWNEQLIKQYVGREALWLHRRILSMCCIRHTGLNQKTSTFIDYELQLIYFCTKILDDCYEDVNAQVTHAATYALWLTKLISDPHWFELQEKLRRLDLKTLLEPATVERILPNIMPHYHNPADSN